MEFTAHFVTYKGTYRDVETEKLNVPTTDGRRTVLSNHMPIMMPLENGVVETSSQGVINRFAITEGMMMFENNEATILCDEIIAVEDIDREMARKAIEAAEKQLATSKHDADIERAQVALRRAVSLMDVADKYNN